MSDPVARYWNERIHDLEVAKHPVGTREFFADLEEYRFDKLRYLPACARFDAYPGREVLEVGCGVGIDLARFARGGARVTGIDLSATAVELAKRHFDLSGLAARLAVMDGAAMSFPDNSFDLVYAHGVLPYAADPEGIVRECRRVLRPGGTALFMSYNRKSWLSLLARVTKVPLEHEDAPVFRTLSPREFRALLAPYFHVQIRGERFPVPTRLHKGLKGFFYNRVFVPGFSILPRRVVRPFGWHLMAYCRDRVQR